MRALEHPASPDRHRPTPPSDAVRRAAALAYGAICHGVFLIGCGAMVLGLGSGLQTGLGDLRGGAAWAADLTLLLQFPILHSAALSAPGRRLLRHLAPRWAGAALDTTLFATFSGIQVAAVFLLWSPLDLSPWRASGPLLWASIAAYAGGWGLLLRAMSEADLRVQTGALGWIALYRGAAPSFRPLPRRGLHGVCRHAIYAAFAVILWAGPVWSLDHLLIALPWTLYCLVGPAFKDERQRGRGGLGAAGGWIFPAAG